jgi:hypothetical protein
MEDFPEPGAPINVILVCSIRNGSTSTFGREASGAAVGETGAGDVLVRETHVSLFWRMWRGVGFIVPGWVESGTRLTRSK